MTGLRERLEHISDRAGTLCYAAEVSQDDVRQAFDFIKDLADALIEVFDAKAPEPAQVDTHPKGGDGEAGSVHG